MCGFLLKAEIFTTTFMILAATACKYTYHTVNFGSGGVVNKYELAMLSVFRRIETHSRLAQIAHTRTHINYSHVKTNKPSLVACQPASQSTK